MTDPFAATTGTADAQNARSNVASSQSGQPVSSDGMFDRKPADDMGRHGHTDGHHGKDTSGVKNGPVGGGQGTQTRSDANVGKTGRPDDTQKHASERNQTGSHSSNVAQQGRTDHGGGPVDRGQEKAGAQTVGSTGAVHTGNSESHNTPAPATARKSSPTDHNVAGAQKHGHGQTTGRGGENGESAPEVKSRSAHIEGDDGNLPKSHQERSNVAETAISDDAKARIAKSEEKDGKRYKKALKEEAKAEDNALKNKMKELESLRKVHKQAVKDEATAAAEHSKAIKDEHKLDLSFLSARSKHDSALTELKAKEEALNAIKRHALEQNQLLQTKQKEVEEFRGKKAADDREREAKLRQVGANPAKVSAP